MNKNLSQFAKYFQFAIITFNKIIPNKKAVVNLRMIELKLMLDKPPVA